MVMRTWQRLMNRSVRGSGVHEQGLKRVALRLAAQTVVLLLVMLLALEIVVYVITRQTLVNSLEATLKTRASQLDPSVCIALGLPCAPGRVGDGPQDTGPRPFERGRTPPVGATATPSGLPSATLNPSEASAVFVDPDRRIVHGEGVLGGVQLSPESIDYVLKTGREECCSVHAYRGQDFLVYTRPLVVNGAALGAVQTSVSEHQYEQTTNTLLEALLLVALLGLIGSGGISALLAQRALQPIRLAMQRQRDFVADAAHELRTPLAIMRTVGEVGMAEPSVNELQSTVTQMLDENQHLTRLVEDLSLLARADTEAMSIERRPVALSTLVTETSAELGALAEANGVTLQAHVQEDIVALGDIVRLRQLLLILLDNALKHTPPGAAVAVRLTRDGDRVRLQVQDSGPGIASHDLPRIFDRFYRADQSRTGEGTGLGLAIGKWIAEAHGGQIQAGNVAPHGALFTVTLPTMRGGSSATKQATPRTRPEAAR